MPSTVIVEKAGIQLATLGYEPGSYYGDYPASTAKYLNSRPLPAPGTVE